MTRESALRARFPGAYEFIDRMTAGEWRVPSMKVTYMQDGDDEVGRRPMPARCEWEQTEVMGKKRGH